MSSSRPFAIVLRFIAAALILAAAGLALFLFERYRQVQTTYPPASIIAGLPMGGLTSDQTIRRLNQAYSVPVEFQYAGAVIQARPAQLGFELDLEAMLAEATQQQTRQPLMDAFWDYLWDRQPPAVMVPLLFSENTDQIRAFLKNEIAPRYDLPISAALPVPGTTTFKPGSAGTQLDIDPAIPLVEQALQSLTARTVTLTAHSLTPPGPSPQNLEILLKQIIDLSGFGGITELYLTDMKTNLEIHFAYQQGKTLSPGIAFTAASTIKIAIMISIFRHLPEPTPQKVLDDLAKMIEVSENDPADLVMQQVIDKNTGPLEVTKDIQALGLKNTFLAGYFYRGAPLLKKFATPANQRKDYFTDPDPYNQTSPADMGQLLKGIYQCAENGGGLFAQVFPGQISQDECKQMITLLLGNHMPTLIAAGPPDGTKVAHKHGWIEELDGVVHTYSDADLIFTPGSDYVLTAYMWDKKQILFDPTNQLMSDLSLAVYNYFNLPK